MTWWESAARADAESAPYAAMGEPEPLDAPSQVDVCPACNSVDCSPQCRRYEKPPPIAESVAGIRELQAVKPHYGVKVLAPDKFKADRWLCITCRVPMPCEASKAATT